jgi:hypothetical protein
MSPVIETRRRGFSDYPRARVLRVLTAATIMASSLSSPPSSEHSPPAADVAKIQQAVSVCVNFVTHFARRVLGRRGIRRLLQHGHWSGAVAWQFASRVSV